MTTNPLRAWRLRSDLSQEELAERLGTNKSTVSRLETNARGASNELLLKIAEVTRGAVTPNDMLGWTAGAGEQLAVRASA